jgi:hypothetical protein
VGLGGLEPPTSPLSGARSSHLSYRPEKTPTILARATTVRIPAIIQRLGAPMQIRITQRQPLPEALETSRARFCILPSE